MENVIIKLVVRKPNIILNIKTSEPHVIINVKARRPNIKVEQALANLIRGKRGEQGVPGEKGVGIVSIAKTSSVGLVDTYTILLSNGQTETFTVTNGKDGEGGSSVPENALTTDDLVREFDIETEYQPESNKVYNAYSINMLMGLFSDEILWRDEVIGGKAEKDASNLDETNVTQWQTKLNVATQKDIQDATNLAGNYIDAEIKKIDDKKPDSRDVERVLGELHVIYMEGINGNTDRITTLENNSATKTEVQNAVDNAGNYIDGQIATVNKKILKLDDEKADKEGVLTELEKYVQKTTTVNGKALSTNIDLTYSDVDALSNTTKYGSSLSLTIDNSTYVVTAQLKDQDGNNLGTAQTIDLPLESVVVSGSYDATTKQVILTLKDGSTVKFSVADLVSGLASQVDLDDLEAEINSINTKITNNNTYYDKEIETMKSNISNNSTGIADALEGLADLENAKVDKTTTVNGKALSSNIQLTRNDIGLGNVDNTSDANKPISTATQTALNDKLSKTSGGTVTGAVKFQQNSLDSALEVNRTTGGGSAIKFSSANGSCSIGTQLDGLPYYWNADHSKGDYLALKNELPTKTSQLTNDAEFETSTNVDNKDLSTLENAKTYTNNKISNMATTDTNQTITASKTFEVGGEKEFVLKIKDNYDYIPIKFYKNSTLIGSLAMNSETGDLYNLYQVGSAAKILNDSMLEIGAFKDDPLPITSGAVYNELTKYATKVALDDKVSKVNGKDLSTNDYSNADKNKLNGIESGAEVNVQSDWNVTDTSSKAYIKNKPVIPQGSVLYDSTGQNTNGAMTQKATTDALSSKLNLSGGSLTGGVVLSGGSGATGAGNIQLSGDGSIADTSGGTLFGRSNSGKDLKIGSSTYNMLLRGKQTRPTYNGNDLALFSDVNNGSKLVTDYTLSSASSSINLTGLDLIADGGIYDVVVVYKTNAGTDTYVTVNNITSNSYKSFTLACYGNSKTATSVGNVSLNKFQAGSIYSNNDGTLSFTLIQNSTSSAQYLFKAVSNDGTQLYYRDGGGFVSLSSSINSIQISTSSPIQAGARIKIYARAK